MFPWYLLKRSLVFPILLFSSISLRWSLRKAFWKTPYPGLTPTIFELLKKRFLYCVSMAPWGWGSPPVMDEEALGHPCWCHSLSISQGRGSWRRTSLWFKVPRVNSGASLVAHMVKPPPATREAWAPFLPGSGGGHGTPLQYSCLEDPHGRGARWATVQGVTKSQT